ncbi:MAG: hypothetical protein WCO55_01700 [Candidatus Falkowbacteria bacterium]
MANEQIKYNGYQSEKTKESPKQQLEQMMAQISQETNRGLGQSIINQRGAIMMATFQQGLGGPYDAETAAHDTKHIANRKLEFSGAYNLPEGPERQKHVALWEKARSESNPELLEMAVTGLLYKELNEDFLVARGAVYDDFENGADNVIVNKHTGDVVCAFDEVHDTDDGEYSQMKNEKILATAMNGGANIKYGLTFDQDKKLVKTALQNIPVFYLSLQGAELDELLADLSTDSHKTSPTEHRFYEKLVNSLEEQRDTLLSQPGLPEPVKANLIKFQYSLNMMKKAKPKLVKRQPPKLVKKPQLT